MLWIWLIPLTAFASSFAESESRQPFLMNSSKVYSCEATLSAELARPPNEFGLVTRNLELNVPNLLMAYERGIFPWGQAYGEMAEWFNPWQRGIMELDKVHIGRTDRKLIRKMEESGEYEVTFDRDFAKVIHECAYQERWTIDKNSGIRFRADPWLSELFMQRYFELHQAGHAHSVEVWRNGKLVAGLYGVFVKGVFSGESMFHNPIDGKDAAKLALKALIDRLRSNGHTFIDTQQAKDETPDARHIKYRTLHVKWGAFLVTRPEYMQRLKEAQARNLPF